MTLTFDEEKHLYFLDGQQIVSVTQALDEAGVTRYWESGETPFYLRRGNNLHLTIKYHVEGVLDSVGGFGPQLEAFKKFERETKFEMWSAENLVCSERMRYAGTPDLVGECFGDPAVIDIKSETYQPWYDLQTAGYFAAINEGKGKKLKRRFVLNLKADGQYRLKECKDPTDVSVFFGCVLIANYKRKWGIGKNDNRNNVTE